MTEDTNESVDWRDLCKALVKQLEVLYKQSVTTSHHQVIKLSNGYHPIPIGNDILMQDTITVYLIDKANKALESAE